MFENISVDSMYGIWSSKLYSLLSTFGVYPQHYRQAILTNVGIGNFHIFARCNGGICGHIHIHRVTFFV